MPMILVGLDDHPVPVEPKAGYTPHAVARELAGDPTYGLRSDTWWPESPSLFSRGARAATSSASTYVSRTTSTPPIPAPLLVRAPGVSCV